MRSLLGLALALFPSPASTPAAAQIPWEASWEAAVSRAKEEGRVLFIALNCDEEARAERFARELYRDSEVVELSALTVNLVGSAADHRSGDRSCRRFGGPSCTEHRRVESALRDEVIPGNESGIVAAPQHVWLAPDRKVLLSVPFEMSREELLWCMVTALRSIDPEKAPPMPEDARPPRRLLMGEIYRPQSADRLGRGLIPAELDEEIKRMKASWGGGSRAGALARIAFTDEKDAAKYLRVELRSGILGWLGTDLVQSSVHLLGVLVPTSGWEAIEVFAKDGDPAVRNEAAVAFEQLGEREAYRTVKTALSREKVPEVEKNWLRALGATGYAEAGARRTLLKAASSEKSELLRMNAIVALGYLDPHADVREALLGLLGSLSRDERRAAACAAAISRDQSYAPALRAAIEAAEDDELGKALESALNVLEGGNLRLIEDLVRKTAEDSVSRERIFFHPIGRTPPGR